jgi:hypothetical protein
LRSCYSHPWAPSLSTGTREARVSKRQQQSKETSTKAVTLSGKVGDDGKSFLSDKDTKTWTVSNRDSLKGHGGQEVKIKAHEDAANNEVHVVSAKEVKGEKAKTKQWRKM